MVRAAFALIIAGVAGAASAGESTNPFTRFYVDNTRGAIDRPYWASSKATEPRLHRTTAKPDDELVPMLEDGYWLMGYSGYTGGAISNAQEEQNARMQAVSVNADLVLLHPHIARGTETLQDGKTVERIEYFASYWGRARPRTFGVVPDPVHAPGSKTPPPADDLVKDAAHAHVLAVVRGSPADGAAIRRGDIVLAIDGRSFESAQDLYALIDARAGAQVTVALFREGQRVEMALRFGAKTF